MLLQGRIRALWACLLQHPLPLLRLVWLLPLQRALLLLTWLLLLLVLLPLPHPPLLLLRVAQQTCMQVRQR